ncbi:hypothetical protein AZF37_01310 [endosymbiont 'TC1' of Trimyema compressum]|uniref:glycoside hydrolase family 25 protein n=1 Tax=endosymbiont 'TC1' of Trimyema compressum TaxID=243899 RepID=UPI0007F11C8C|nr:GH25 family lysozyme [endosymbiont 'TC1' of Trimyema compressum]AMP19996.1 hypothetical protein AZF37_01310 [endosymbiont 'TC1' of Trimyema compressum]
MKRKNNRKKAITLKDKKILIIGILLVGLLMIGVFITLMVQPPVNHFTIGNGKNLKGIDVSNHQGKIDWQALPHDKINYVFIKATEGTTYNDPFFKGNWQNASEYNFLKGAYHFFTVGTSGADQAKAFIAQVPKEKNVLTPVIDLELIGENREEIITEIRVFVNKIEEHYEVKPIFYINKNTFHTYVEGVFNDYMIWYADYADEPALDESIWTFWQYTESGLIEGIKGPVDFNIFRGNKQDLESIIIQ